MRYPSYPQYKSSEVEWMGDIPEHWEVKRIKYIGRIRYGLGEPPEYVDEGLNFIRATDISRGKIDLSNVKKVSPDDVPWNRNPSLQIGDIIVVRSGAYTGDSAYIPEECYGSIAGYDMVLNVGKNDSRFFGYVLLSKYMLEGQIYLAKMRAAQPHLNAEELGGMIVLFPPKKEQEQIATFLDHETSRIDRLIEKKRQFIETLKEKRTALISHVVTKGLDPDAKLKPSGIDWLGNVPEHWEVKRLRFLCSTTTGDKDTINSVEDGEYPFFVRSQTVERIDSYTYDGEAVLTAGDGVGVAKVFHHYIGKFDFHQRVYKFSNFKYITGRFFYYYMKENFFKEAIKNSAKSTVDSLRLPMIQNFTFSVPPIDEQDLIVHFLDHQTDNIDKLINKVEEAIQVLQEYRSAIISEVVTGKIDVRDAVK